MRADSYVYQLRRVDSDLPFYVGKGRLKRAWDHFKPSQLGYKTIKANIINKSIREGVEILVEFIFENLTDQEAVNYEIWAISAYGRRKTGTGVLSNLTDGGEGVTGPRGPLSAEHRRKISEFQKGKKTSDDTKQKMSTSMRGKTRSAEGRMNMKLANQSKIPMKCPHCSVFAKPSMLTRYHKDNCKFKV